jgi:hypothetical protein
VRAAQQQRRELTQILRLPCSNIQSRHRQRPCSGVAYAAAAEEQARAALVQQQQGAWPWGSAAL